MDEIYMQLFCLVIFILTGIIIGILFDCFRVLRRSFKTADWITYIQDIIFWILTGIIILFSIFKFNNGEIRSYIILGIFFGALIYMLTISKFVIKYSVRVINLLKKIISYPINIIINILKKIIINPLKNIFTQNKTKNNKNLQKENENNSQKSTNLKEKRGFLQKM